MLRSASRYKALDETAVLGYACRHEFPGGFLHLKHGERLSYSTWMLEKIINRHEESGAKIFVMYDIGCTLSAHLKSQGRFDLLENCHLCLPSFHSYGHKVSCQLRFGPRRCEGVGLSDGETMERLWSYLRRYVHMTKEMRPSHRIDVLTGALVYYGIRTKAKLGILAHLFYLVLTMLCMYIASLLCVRLERALKAKLIAEESLHQLLPGFVIEQPDEMKKWIAEEELACAENNFKKPVAWKLLYFQTLLSYYSLKKLLVSGMSSESKSEQLEWLENRLEEMERSHSIPSCWLPTDEEYKKSEYAVLLTKKEQILMQIWKSGQSRLFLLQLKRRYADGQKIAKKLSLQISKATKAIQSQLEEYKVSTEDTMTLSEALDPSAVETRLHQLGSWGAIATGRRREIIDAYLALCRSNEEIEMLEQDARNCIAFYERKKEVITSELLYRSVNSDPYNRGAAALLMDLMHQTSHLLTDSIKTLGIISTRIHQQNIEDDYSDISSSTCSEDSFDESEHI